MFELMVGKNDGRRRVKICPNFAIGTAENGDGSFRYYLADCVSLGCSSGEQNTIDPNECGRGGTPTKAERFRGNGTSTCHSLQEKITFLHEIFTSATAEVVLPSLQPLNWCSTRTSEGSVKMPQNWGAAYSAVAVLQDSLAELDSSREHLSGKQLSSDAFAHDTSPRTTRSRPNRAVGDGHHRTGEKFRVAEDHC